MQLEIAIASPIGDCYRISELCELVMLAPTGGIQQLLVCVREHLLYAPRTHLPALRVTNPEGIIHVVLIAIWNRFSTKSHIRLVNLLYRWPLLKNGWRTEVLVGTLEYCKVLLGTSVYFEVLLGTYPAHLANSSIPISFAVSALVNKV